MIFLHNILLVLTIFFAFNVYFSRNPIESVLFLILVFCSSSFILFIINSEFLGLIFVIIYVGAIAVLFLFIIMLLNIKEKDVSTSVVDYYRDFFWYFIILFFNFDLILTLFLVDFENRDFVLNFIVYTDILTNINVMGQYLFNYYLPLILLAGIVLLVALVGPVILTLKFNYSSLNQFFNKQLSRGSVLVYFSRFKKDTKK